MSTEKINKELDEFLENEPKKHVEVESEKELITPRTGLVEKVDRTLVVPDGRQLLTEIYN